MSLKEIAERFLERLNRMRLGKTGCSVGAREYSEYPRGFFSRKNFEEVDSNARVKNGMY